MNETHHEDYSEPDIKLDSSGFPMTETRRASERHAFVPNGLRAIEEALRGSSVPTPGIDATLIERNERHGEFRDDAEISQKLKDVIHIGKNWGDLSNVQREALENIATKIGRILSGDPNYIDHWNDVIGYCTLVVQRLP